MIPSVPGPQLWRIPSSVSCAGGVLLSVSLRNKLPQSFLA